LVVMSHSQRCSTAQLGASTVRHAGVLRLCNSQTQPSALTCQAEGRFEHVDIISLGMRDDSSSAVCSHTWPIVSHQFQTTSSEDEMCAWSCSKSKRIKTTNPDIGMHILHSACAVINMLLIYSTSGASSFSTFPSHQPQMQGEFVHKTVPTIPRHFNLSCKGSEGRPNHIKH
jgi:hypothetical protein